MPTIVLNPAAAGFEQAGEDYIAPHRADAPAAESSDVAAGPPAFISDSELLLWLESKSQEMYGRVREAMGVSTERSELMQELTRLKGVIESDKPRTNEIIEAVDAVVSRYSDTAFIEELMPIYVSAQVPGSMSEEQQKALAGDIQALIDKLGHDDQLALIEIQNLMANIRETSQLASNVLASRDQASNTIVGNIRG